MLTRENRGTLLAVYIARVRITVHADGVTIIREGHGTGEGRGPSAGEVHDIALKAAETDATKRAFSTFGKPFGLALYGAGKTATAAGSAAAITASTSGSKPADHQSPIGFGRDDTTPIPRPSTFYGRRQNPVSRALARPGLVRGEKSTQEKQPPADPSIVPSPSDLLPGQIDKSALAIAEPKRIVLHAKALPGNPYNGHTLRAAIEDTERLTGRQIERAYVDKGYRGHDVPNPHRVFISGQKRGVFGAIKRELHMYGGATHFCGNLRLIEINKRRSFALLGI